MTPEFDTPQRQQFPKDVPEVESTVSVSKNGRYLLHRTTITHIKPVAYYEAILRARAKAPDDREHLVLGPREDSV